MRIIAGNWKGRRLNTPPGLATRPLPDRLKQQVFDWLGPWCDDWRVIDICAGSGSFGFEAVSRGAVRVDAIEAGRDAAKAWHHTHTALGKPEQLQLHQGRFQQVLPRLDPATVIWADPPFPWYHEDPATLRQLLELAADKLYDDMALLLIRGERGGDLPLLPPTLIEVERRDYGRSWIAALRRTPSNDTTPT